MAPSEFEYNHGRASDQVKEILVEESTVQPVNSPVTVGGSAGPGREGGGDHGPSSH